MKLLVLTALSESDAHFKDRYVKRGLTAAGFEQTIYENSICHLIQEHQESTALEIIQVFNRCFDIQVEAKFQSLENGYKSERSFRFDQYVCYVPAKGNRSYRRSDFLKLCGDDQQMAERLFSLCEWQFPESMIMMSAVGSKGFGIIY
ncbi:hypothetical protein ABHN11_24780 [Brevibacillus centrosporus]|uniref:hypothetical protein n=1 Tax=Brevibacillus centrosporus TaxID=54910 RepID=UPI003D1EFDE3